MTENTEGEKVVALSVVYDLVHQLIRNGLIKELDGVLERAESKSLSTDLWLTLLTATGCVKDRSVYRERYYAAAEAEFTSRYGAEEAEALLAGLK